MNKRVESEIKCIDCSLKRLNCKFRKLTIRGLSELTPIIFYLELTHI